MASNKIHRIWLGGPMPDNFVRYGYEWGLINPDHDICEWNQEMINDEDWINKAVLSDMTKRSKRPGADMVAFYTHYADALCYETIYKYGGWYVNTDLKPLKPLSTLVYDKNAPAFANEDDIHAVNMAMYCPANDPLFANIIELLPIRYFGMPGAFMNATTGVQLIMQALSIYNGPLTRFNKNVFNPIHFSEFGYGAEPNINREYSNETVAVHLWGHRTNQRGQRILENE